MMTRLAIAGYRSRRDIAVTLGPLVVTGANGSGRSSLYRALKLLAKRSQAVVVSHATALVAALGADPDCREIVLEKHLGETIVRDGTPPDWIWPSR